MGKEKLLHLIGNAHLDPVWLWRWPEGYETARATFRSVLDLMKDNPDFYFTSSQAAVYEWIERGDPALLAEIKDRISEGRWCIVGGWWMQPDCNLPSGESFIRQGLYGQKFFLEKLGVMSRVGYNVDSFGHNNMLPQILSKLGLSFYIFMRPMPNENPNVPGELFWWESPDGSRVLTYRIPESYGAWGDWMEEKLRRTAELIGNMPALMEFYGVGNHGGGPTKDNFARIEKLRQDETLPSLIYSTPEKFFESLDLQNPEIPVWKDDLQHHASGCYAVHSEIKKNNRLAEHLLEAAEKYAVLAEKMAGLPYPSHELEKAWKAVLFNQFHDILAGTSIVEAYKDARDLHGVALQAANEVITFATGAISSQMDTAGEGIPIVVFNPLSWGRNEYCDCELHEIGPEVSVFDDEGKEVDCQVIEPSSVVWENKRTRICFKANVDPIGCAVYRALPRKSNSKAGVKASEKQLNNDLLIVHFSHSGRPFSLLDKVCGTEYLCGLIRARVIEDKSDTWSHGVFRFDKEIGEFKTKSVSVVEDGPVRGILRVQSEYGDSKLIEDFRIYKGVNFLECECWVDWREHHKILKITVPVKAEKPLAVYETAYGQISREPNGEEEPGLRWVDVGDDEQGICLVNDSKYSYDVNGCNLSLTAIRSPVYAHHEPRELKKDDVYRYIDQGEQTFSYRIYPRSGKLSDFNPHKRASEMNLPLYGLSHHSHAGVLGRRCSLIEVDSENIVISVVKKSEDGNCITIRAFETNGIGTNCSFRFMRGEISWDSYFGCHEIKTFKIGDGRVVETDFLEREIAEIDILTG